VSTTEFIHRFLPAAPEDKTPRTLLLLHGTGGDENDLIDLGRALDPTAAILSPRGRVLENGAPRFFRRLAEGIFDEADVIARAHELAGFIKSAVIEYNIDTKSLVAVGYSNGANIAAAMMLLGVADFPRAILLRAMVPLAKPVPVPAPASATALRALVAEGQFDPIANPDNGRRLTEMLRATGAIVDLIFQPAGHELTSEDMMAARRWLTS
jgi:phospholipase/carboxylesterase